MIEINTLNKKATNICNPSISLCGKLEAYIGNYFLSGTSVPGQEVETLYYDPSVGLEDEIEFKEENIVAYFVAEESIAFVKEEMLEKLKQDTEEYEIYFIPVESFDLEILCINQNKEIPDYLKDIIWVDDAFMLDATIPFDYEAFEIIDSKVDYLNPNHFSVSQLIRLLKRIR